MYKMLDKVSCSFLLHKQWHVLQVSSQGQQRGLITADFQLVSRCSLRTQYLRTWPWILHVLLSVQRKEVISISRKGLHVHAVDGVNLY